ncbi:L-Aspartase-like protein, partial [Melanogaster broomeanus]
SGYGSNFVRLNSLIRAQSGTRWIVIEGLYNLLVHNIAPCGPLRQSFLLRCCQKIGMQPIEFIAKEGLSLINVPLPAVDNGSVVLMACFSAVEVLKGSQEPFNSYLHGATRPHPGQVESAANIRRVLLPSKLARPHHVESDPEATLRQDRYCLRAVPQWLGPQLEDLQFAQKTLDLELNSTTDNPIVDVQNEYLHHGANFMAMAVTSATEKMRLAVHHMVGEPSVDYSLKGADIAAAAYLSEIAYLSNPVSTHVISAEMHNQFSLLIENPLDHPLTCLSRSINSLALISGRYTLEAVKLCSMLMSTHIFALCQAADLRAMEATFRCKFFSVLRFETATHFPSISCDNEFFRLLTNRLITLLNGTTDQDSATRFERVMSDLASTLISFLDDRIIGTEVPLKAINQWRESLARSALHIFLETRESYASFPSSAAAAARSD